MYLLVIAFGRKVNDGVGNEFSSIQKWTISLNILVLLVTFETPILFVILDCMFITAIKKPNLT